MLKKLITLILAAAAVISLTAVSCFAADMAAYQLDVTYTVTNNSGSDIDELTYSFDFADTADDSAYQPNTRFSRSFTGASVTIKNERERYNAALAKGESESVTFTWTFSGGEFDQYPAKTATYETAYNAYNRVVESLAYGEKQANCQTFATLFCDLLQEEDIECRKVYGYAVRLADRNGNIMFGEADISETAMHVWCEWFDPAGGDWIFADPTFDDENTEFRFFGKCPADSPHLAMYYGELPSQYISWDYRDTVEFTRTAKLKRAEYADNDPQTENLLERTERLENEQRILAEYAASKGLKFTINRDASGFSFNTGTAFNMPPDYRLSVDEFGDLRVDGDGGGIRMQFAQDGAFRLFT